jgi:DNA mismatch repair protein MutH
LERAEALVKIRELIGQDLRPLADRYGVTVWTSQGKKNKGWAGHTIERYLGLPLNSSQSPNFGSWELKVVPLKRRRDGNLQVKETMAITMIDPVEVSAKEFENSHLYSKLRKAVIVSRIFESQAETSSLLYAATQFDLDNPKVFSQVKADYEEMRNKIKTEGFSALSGKMGTLVQPRTKGAGHGSTSRAFYARTGFVAHILNLVVQSPVIPIQTEPEPQESEISP